MRDRIYGYEERDILKQGSRPVYGQYSMLVTDGKQVLKAFTYFGG